MPDIENEAVLRFFSNAKVLNMLDDDGRRQLMEAATAEKYTDGQVVMKEGEPGDAMYIIIDGIASVSIDDLGLNKPVAELTDGAFFGEMGVITDQPRSATVKAYGGLSVLKIPKKAVQKILEQYPKMKEVVAKIGIARTEDTFKKMMED